jgi:N-acetylglucosamine kinase-like BadF-type ATPase
VSLVVGVDAGGSRTTAVAADGDAVLATFHGDAANVRVAGIDSAASTIARSVANVLSGRAADAVVVGAAGAGRPDIARALEDELVRQLVGARVSVVDDAAIALRAAVPDGDGIVLIAGTGSIAYAEVAGVAHRAGGYGYLLGDEGSGFAIGAAAVKLLLRSYDGRTPRDPMLEALESQLDARNAQDVLAAVYERPNSVAALAALAPIVLEHASGGERSATKIVQVAALELSDLVKALVRNANVADREMALVLTGGLLRANSMLSFLLETRISHELPLLRPHKNPPPAELGALALARALLNA